MVITRLVILLVFLHSLFSPFSFLNLTLRKHPLPPSLPPFIQAIALAPFFLFLVVQIFCLQMLLCGTAAPPPPAAPSRINNTIELESPKVATMEDHTKEKKVYCRCWKSKTFPYCDGSHAKHNKETGDNVGPLIVKGAE